MQSGFILKFIFYNPSSVPPVDHLRFEYEFFLAKTFLWHRKVQTGTKELLLHAETSADPWNTILKISEFVNALKRIFKHPQGILGLIDTDDSKINHCWLREFYETK